MGANTLKLVPTTNSDGSIWSCIETTSGTHIACVEDEANATLFAASKDLLEAAQALLEAMRRDESLVSVSVAMRGAELNKIVNAATQTHGGTA